MEEKLIIAGIPVAVVSITIVMFAVLEFMRTSKPADAKASQTEVRERIEDRKRQEEQRRQQREQEHKNKLADDLIAKWRAKTPQERIIIGKVMATLDDNDPEEKQMKEIMKALVKSTIEDDISAVEKDLRQGAYEILRQ